MTRAVVVSLVEKGWAGARRASIPLAREGLAVRHLVKGRLRRDLLEVITPHPGMTLAGCPPRWYRLAAWLALLWGLLQGRLAWVLVDNDRAARWVARSFPMAAGRVVLVQEAADGSPILLRQGRTVEPQALAAKAG